MIDDFVTLTGRTLLQAYAELRADFPQKAIKRREGGGGDLSSINPAYQTEKVSEVFGMCGIGWQYGHEEMESGSPDARVALVWFRYAYYDAEGEDNKVRWSEKIPAYGMGNVRKGMTDGDARKSAVTDGLTKALSMVGVGISVFKGEQSHHGPRKQPTQPTAKPKPPPKETPKPNPQKKADDESMPIVQLWIKAEAADVPPDEWKLWLKEYAITKDRRTQGVKKMELLQKKITEWAANSRDEKLFISEDEISWLRSTAEASDVDIQGEDGLLKFCQAAINNFELKDLKTLTKDEFDACMKELNERSAEGSHE